ncbi:MAG: hypothetical protein IIC95_08865 [Chloroflexi bacterium]|nr:hypothetical protein [Chloroflexota bacterium]MCH7656072.1 hypothetical protein [Chloroflexota bacterium]
MSIAIVTVMMTALLLGGVAVFAQGSFAALTKMTDAWNEMEDRTSAMARTSLEAVSTSYATPTIDVTMLNSGGIALRDFAKWDVVVQYYETDGTYRSAWLPYTGSTPVADNSWGVVGLYQDAAASKPEAYQPNILDPGEHLVISIVVDPPADSTANNRVLVGTPNAATLSSAF